MKAEVSVLFDVPGPRARVRNNVYAVLAVVALLAVAYWIYAAFDAENQWQARLWEPFLQADTWTDYMIPGLLATLNAAAQAAVLALIFGVVFGIARLSHHAWIRVPAAMVVEFFRAIPLVLLIFFIFFLQIGGVLVDALTAVVVGLMLYNGSVLAEIFRAGILAIPKGQSEAAYAVGLRKTGVMIHILVPQAVTAMLPAIISQLVVLLKDTALGYIVAYEELLNRGIRQLPPANFNNVIQAAIVVAIVYIGVNMTLSQLATWLEGRQRRKGKTVIRATGGPMTPGGAVVVGAPSSEAAEEN